MSDYYIASCIFTERHPELSLKVQQYIKEHFDMPVVRCCTPSYKIEEFEGRMSACAVDSWKALLPNAELKAGDAVYSVCHNCSNIIEALYPDVKVMSLWELILQDESFVYPDLGGISVTLQDCWRSHWRAEEQNAVREILRRMNCHVVEMPENRENTQFCGTSLHRKQPERNPKLAPKVYVDKATGKFIPVSEEKQKEIMKEYCSQIVTEEVICYCHYCLEGLLAGGADAKHLAQLLF